MSIVLDLYQLDLDDMAQSEASLLQETEQQAIACLRHIEPHVDHPENDIVDSVCPPQEDPVLAWVGDPRLRIFAEESGDGYVRQLAAAAAQFMVEDVSAFYMKLANGRLPHAEIAWQAYFRWQHTAQQTFYFDADFDQVTLPMIHAWVRRKLLHLHHQGASPVYQQQHLISRDPMPLDMEYAAFYLLCLVLETMRF